MLLYLLFFGVIIVLFVSLSMMIATDHVRVFPTHSIRSAQPATAQLPSEIEPLPRIPQTLAQIHTFMDHDQFEYFSAALVIALGEGHRFHSRVGGAGDDGVDAKLTNLYGNLVLVQSKLYSSGNNVGPDLVRDFMGAISLKDAVYGYFVTTSELTKQAWQTAKSSRRPIRVIDGKRIERMLQHRSREIALAYRDVLDAI
jgi:hypothetical protein